MNNENIIQNQALGATASYKPGDTGYNNTDAAQGIDNDIETRAIANENLSIDPVHDHYILVTLNNEIPLDNLQCVVLYQSDARIEGCAIELLNSDDELIYTTGALPLHGTEGDSTSGVKYSIRLDGPIDFSGITTTSTSEFATKIIDHSTQTIKYTIQ